MRHAALPVTVTIRATPFAHGVPSKVKKCTTSRTPFQLCRHDWVESTRDVDGAPNEPPDVRRRAAADLDPAGVAVALDHVDVGRGHRRAGKGRQRDSNHKEQPH